MPASEKDVAKDNEQGVVPVPADGENHSLLLTIAGLSLPPPELCLVAVAFAVCSACVASPGAEVACMHECYMFMQYLDRMHRCLNVKCSGRPLSELPCATQ